MRLHKAFGQHIDLDHVAAITAWEPLGPPAFNDHRVDYGRDAIRVLLGTVTMLLRDKPLELWATMETTAAMDYHEQEYAALIAAWSEASPQSPTAASADDVAARPPVAGLTLAEAQEADYILVVKGDTIKFLKDKRGNSTALDLVDPKEAYEITKEGARCRDTPGAVNPYPANTMKSQLHSQGWLTRDLQLCLARSNPRYRAQQLRGGSITEEGIRGGYGFESHTVFVEEKGQ